MKELENCLWKLDRGVSRKLRNWAKQQIADVNKLELRSQLGRRREKLPLEYFENEMRVPSSAELLMANPFNRTERQFVFTWCLAGNAWKDLNSGDKTSDKTIWSSWTKDYTCTGWWCSMLLHAALESIPERRSTNLNWSSWEGFNEKHRLFLMDSPGYCERARELSKELDRGVSRKRRNWAKQQKAKVNKLDLRTQLGRTWEKLLLEYFENEMRPPSSAQHPMANSCTRTERQFLFTWCLAGVAFKDLNSSDKMKYGDISLYVCQMMMRYLVSCSTSENTRAAGNKSEMIPLRRDSRGTILVPGG